MDTRSDVREFLSTRRARVTPDQAGLPAYGGNRRVPGLRREEVAQLTGMSVDYYSRLEQARAPQPSPHLLRPLARSLRLSDDERDHLYYLAGRTPPATVRSSPHVSPGLLHVLDHLTDSVAFVVTDLGETLVQNSLALALNGDQSQYRGLDRYGIWRFFNDPASRARVPDADRPVQARTQVADLRATAARRGPR